VIGTPRVHHRSCDSTNARGRELAAGGAPHGTLVTADEQADGRGRQGRSWTAPARTALLMSLVLRDLGPARELLPLVAAVAVCEACEEAAPPVRCRIKWPNDVWIDGRKVAGILIEGRPAEGWTVLGIGLNVSTGAGDFPPELSATATSLRLAGDGSQIATEAMLRSVLDRLYERLDQPPAEVLTRWRERDALHGLVVRWNGGDGVAAGIDDSGALLVDAEGGCLRLDAGEVHLRAAGPPASQEAPGAPQRL